MNDWPLVWCDASAVNEAEDLEPADLLYPDLATENYQVYYSPKYKWYYLSDHTTSEVVVFLQADSSEDGLPGERTIFHNFTSSIHIGLLN